VIPQSGYSVVVLSPSDEQRSRFIAIFLPNREALDFRSGWVPGCKLNPIYRPNATIYDLIGPKK
jgi:hypothetical protein